MSSDCVVRQWAPQTFMSIPWGAEQERAHRAFVACQFNTSVQQYSGLAASLGVKRFGRPSKYREEFCGIAFYMLADKRAIFTLKSIAAILGISYDTLNHWQHRYPDFCHALAQGKAEQEAWLATCLMNGWGNPQGILFILRVLHGWRREGRRSEDAGSTLRDALEAQATGARRVQWDKAIPTSPSVSLPAGGPPPPR